MKKILAWHFVRDNRMLGYDSQSLEVVPGYIYSISANREPELCSYGMHASRRVIDALGNAPGSYLCRVRVWGDVAEDNDKLVGRHREVLWASNVESELRLWGCWCVRQVWHLLTDDRSRKAVEVAEAFALSKATKAQLLQSRESAFKAKDKIRNSKNIDFYSPDWAAAEAAWAAICTTGEPSEMSTLAWHVNEASVASDVKRRISGEGYIRKYLDAELDKRILEVFETPGVTL